MKENKEEYFLGKYFSDLFSQNYSFGLTITTLGQTCSSFLSLTIEQSHDHLIINFISAVFLGRGEENLNKKETGGFHC